MMQPQSNSFARDPACYDCPELGEGVPESYKIAGRPGCRKIKDFVERHLLEPISSFVLAYWWVTRDRSGESSPTGLIPIHFPQHQTWIRGVAGVFGVVVG